MARDFRRLTDPGVRMLTETGRWAVPGLGLRLTWQAGKGVTVSSAAAGARRHLLALVAELVEHGRDLRRCPRCRTPFLSRGKRLFCSAACTRAAMDERKALRRLAAHERQVMMPRYLRYSRLVQKQQKKAAGNVSRLESQVRLLRGRAKRVKDTQ